jgi:hypothetical protein
MEFLTLLSPDSSGDYITIIFLVVIFTFFFFEAIRLFRKIARLKKSLKSIDVKDYESFNDSYPITNYWISYKSSFGFDDLNKTTEDANDYFNENSLILNNSNFRHFLTLPSIFVGIGILGTFVGLVIGISSFDLSNSTTIKDSIAILLGGMATAFYTSIAGMFTSIVFNLFEKTIFHSVYKEIKQLANELNLEYKINKKDLEFHQMNIQLDLIQQSFGFKDEEGNQVKPNVVFSTIYRELQESTKALKSFSTDLANSIEATQAIIMDEFDQSFQKAFKETLLPVIEKLDAAVEALKNEKASTNENLINSTIEKLETSMKEMLNSFKEEVSGGAKAELENMIKALSSSANVLSSLPSLLNGFEQNISSAAEHFENMTTQSSERERQNMEESNLRRKEVNAETEEALMKSLEVIEKAKEFVSGFTIEAEKMTDSIKSYQYLIDNIYETGEKLLSSSEVIAEMTQLNIDYNDKTQETNKLLAENFQNQIQQITRANQDHLKNYELIQGSIKEVFEGIDQGLNNYRGHTVKAINDYLGEFSDKLSKASAALSGSIDELNEGVEDLNDFFGKIKK